MHPAKNRDRILEAIDQLRRRKARPDVQRICNYLFRRFAVGSVEAKTDLQWCVENDVVLKVEYKGSISYRNAAKKYAHVRRLDDADKANRKFAQLLTNAFGELVVHEPDYLEIGVPADEIVHRILSKDSVRYTKKYISILLDKEVENGGLVRLEGERYLMGPHKEEPLDEPKKPPDQVNAENAALRVGGRRKRAKKVFDPSDTHIPKKRGRPAGSLNKSTIEKQLAKMSDDSRPNSRGSSSSREQGRLCSVCHVDNKKGPNDKMITCRACGGKAHYGCLKAENMLLRKNPDNLFGCPQCITCAICFETSDAGLLTVCVACADAYHATCHRPSIPDKSKRPKRWLCTNCEAPDDQKILNEIESHLGAFFPEKDAATNHEESNDNTPSPSVSVNSTPYQSPPLSPTPPQLSPQNEPIPDLADPEPSQGGDGGISDSQSIKDSDDDNVDPSIPDASNWTSEEVYQYFAQYFPREAKIFKEQDIDGKSLLLLKRMDVLTNLKLKLGPALKIYKHVVKLQVRRDDPKLYWL